MNVSPDRQTLIDLAAALNTDPAFLEKDYYVCHVIKALAEFNHEQLEAIFCGGTSLLHGYKIINRFSEDVDFRIISHRRQPTARDERRAYRDALFENLHSIPDINVIEKSKVSRDASRFFSVMLSYPRQFEDHGALRPEIKLEGTFDRQVVTGLEIKEIKPIIGQHIEVDCISNIRCLSLLQTSADKLSALSWRVIVRRRGEDDPDSAVIRHLYDIHALAPSFGAEFPQIVRMAEIAYGTDRTRRGGKAPDQLHEAMAMALEIFKTDNLYEQEYDQYVRSMCFGETLPPEFADAVGVFESLLKKDN